MRVISTTGPNIHVNGAALGSNIGAGVNAASTNTHIYVGVRRSACFASRKNKAGKGQNE